MSVDTRAARLDQPSDADRVQASASAPAAARVDPVTLEVVRSALGNAASIAGLMLTTEALVTTLDKDDKGKQRVEGSVR